MTDFVHTPAIANRKISARLLLAHGAMGPMDSPVLTALSAALAACGLGVDRFEFSYMAQRRAGGKKRPPPRAEALMDEYRAAIDVVWQDTASSLPMFIGGKSLGGRVASLIADEAYDAGTIAGLICFGYPFHPPKQPERLRTAHLTSMRCPALIVQGERDPFGTRDEVHTYDLATDITVHWICDGDHDLKPRKRSGATHPENLADAASAAAQFALALTRDRSS